MPYFFLPNTTYSNVFMPSIAPDFVHDGSFLLLSYPSFFHHEKIEKKEIDDTCKRQAKEHRLKTG